MVATALLVAAAGVGLAAFFWARSTGTDRASTAGGAGIPATDATSGTLAGARQGRELGLAISRDLKLGAAYRRAYTSAYRAAAQRAGVPPPRHIAPPAD
jgi:hypothetical protein